MAGVDYEYNFYAKSILHHYPEGKIFLLFRVDISVPWSISMVAKEPGFTSTKLNTTGVVNCSIFVNFMLDISYLWDSTAAQMRA